MRWNAGSQRLQVAIFQLLPRPQSVCENFIRVNIRTTCQLRQNSNHIHITPTTEHIHQSATNNTSKTLLLVRLFGLNVGSVKIVRRKLRDERELYKSAIF